MGNICRSPTAQGVFERLVDEEGLSHLIEIDSAGTHAYHIGEPPDPRSQQAARRRGIELGGQRARKVAPEDFEHYDYLLAMDRSNLSDLHAICPVGQEHKLKLFLSLAGELDEDEVPDPYYGGGNGFEYVLDLVEQAASALLKEIRERYL